MSGHETTEEEEASLVAKEQSTLMQELLAAGASPLPWRPIGELTPETRYGNQGGFLVLAPELVDLDCNVFGVGMAYWQDGAGAPVAQEPFEGAGGGTAQPLNEGAWLACKWSMTNDEWSEVTCTPTHYLRLTGVAPPQQKRRVRVGDSHYGKLIPGSVIDLDIGDVIANGSPHCFFRNPTGDGWTPGEIVTNASTTKTSA